MVPGPDSTQGHGGIREAKVDTTSCKPCCRNSDTDGEAPTSEKGRRSLAWSGQKSEHDQESSQEHPPLPCLACSCLWHHLPDRTNASRGVSPSSTVGAVQSWLHQDYTREFCVLGYCLRSRATAQTHELATLSQHFQGTVVQGVARQAFQTSPTDVLNNSIRTGADDRYFSSLFSQIRSWATLRFDDHQPVFFQRNGSVQVGAC